MLSTYQFAGDNPIRYIDLDGLEPAEYPLALLNQELGKVQGAIENQTNKIKKVTSDMVEATTEAMASADKTINGWLSKYGIVTFGEGQSEDESHLRKRTDGMQVDMVDKDAVGLLMKRLQSKLPKADPTKRRSDQMKKYMEDGAKKKLQEENIKNITKEGKKMLNEGTSDGSSSNNQSHNLHSDGMGNDTIISVTRDKEGKVVDRDTTVTSTR